MSIISSNMSAAGISNVASLSNIEQRSKPNQQEKASEEKSGNTGALQTDTVELSSTEKITDLGKTETNPKQADDKVSAQDMSEQNVAGENIKPASYADSGSGEPVESNSVVGSQIDMQV